MAHNVLNRRQAKFGTECIRTGGQRSVGDVVAESANKTFYGQGPVVNRCQPYVWHGKIMDTHQTARLEMHGDQWQVHDLVCDTRCKCQPWCNEQFTAVTFFTVD